MLTIYILIIFYLNFIMTNNVNCVSDFNSNEFINNAYNKNSDNFDKKY